MVQQTAGRSISEMIALVADTGIQTVIRQNSQGCRTKKAEAYDINIQDFNQACEEQQVIPFIYLFVG